MLECLERLLLKKFLEQGESDNFPSFPKETRDLLVSARGSSTQSSVEQLLADQAMSSFLTEFCRFREEMRLGQHGKTGQLWITYMDHVWLVLSLLHAVKTNDYELCAHTLQIMPDLFFSFRGMNYARYLTFFGLFLANIETTHPGATDLLRCGAFSVARSLIPGNRCAVDKTMEETFQKHAKSRGAGTAAGAIGLTNNFEAYQRWVRSTHERIKYVKATLNLADMTQSSEIESQHRDLRPSSILGSEDSVQRALKAIEGFTNPFAVDPTRLVMLASGASAPQEIENDVLRAEEIGKEHKEAFIKERLIDRQKGFFEPIKQVNLKTMGTASKVLKLRSTNNKITELRQTGNIALQLLVKSDEGKLALGLKEMMAYQLTPVPYSLATADNFMTKTDKSMGFHYLTKGIEDHPSPDDAETLLIIDGNALFHSMTQVPSAFSQICLKVFDMVPKSSDFVFSTDMYEEGSIKSMERTRRGTGDKIFLSGAATKRPADWGGFLSNDENKSQFAKLLLQVWSQDTQAKHVKGRNIILVHEGRAFKISSHDGTHTDVNEVEDLASTQEETDTRIILYCQYAIEQGYRFIRVKSPDTDVFFLLLYYASQMPEATIFFDTGKGNKKRLINISSLAQDLTQIHCTAYLALHAFSGCDSTSAFKGKGKVKPLKILRKTPKFVNTFAKLGETWALDEDLLDELDVFTCFMYSWERFVHVNDVRHQMLKDKCDEEGISPNMNIDLSALPPCRRTLKQHCRRANYQTALWKRSHLAKPEVPLPQNGHGWEVQDGMLQPLWTEADEELLLPDSVVDELLQEDLQEDGGLIEDEEGSVEECIWFDDPVDSDDDED